MLMATDKTTSFTPEQQAEVDKVLTGLLKTIEPILNREGLRIRNMDKRPNIDWTEAQPDVFFPYVIQAMLEDLIAELQARV